MTQVGDVINIDNSNPYAKITEFRESILDPLYYQLTGQRKALVTKMLCGTSTVGQDGKPNTNYQYVSVKEVEKDPLKYVPVKDEHNNTISITNWEDERDPHSVRLCNDKGANFIIHELNKFFNDKVLMGVITRDEAVNTAGDCIDTAFSYIIFNEDEYEVKDATQLIASAVSTMNMLYTFLTALTDGKMREALVAILTGGGLSVKQDAGGQQQQSQNFGEQVKNKFQR